MHTLQFTTPTERYHVSSYGNGWAYEIFCQTTGASLWFQDHDADEIQRFTNNFENEDNIEIYFDMLEISNVIANQ